MSPFPWLSPNFKGFALHKSTWKLIKLGISLQQNPWKYVLFSWVGFLLFCGMFNGQYLSTLHFSWGSRSHISCCLLFFFFYLTLFLWALNFVVLDSQRDPNVRMYILATTCKYGFYLKRLAMIFAGQENPLIIFRSQEIYIYFKTNNKIPVNLL